MAEFKIQRADQVDAPRLEQFLHRAYGPIKGDFLARHGAWWHRGNDNRLLVLSQGEIAAYCAVIPTRCRVGGTTHAALWWVDLVVLPEFRGLGLQRILDREMRERADLKLGFPNRLAARIHRRHGWGVREDFRVLMLPLEPRRLRMVRSAGGVRGAILRAGSSLLTPAARSLRRRLSEYQPAGARPLTDPDVHALADIFFRYQDEAAATSVRDPEFLRWRYLEAPYRSELDFYVAGPAAGPRTVLISRRLDQAGARAVRILDLFGDLSDRSLLRDLLLTCVRDAAGQGAVQVTILAALPRLRALLRSIGFWGSVKARFCWHSQAPELREQLGNKACHFCFADSDNDGPD
jgi:GNAT superfamily N-acetyltransferase